MTDDTMFDQATPGKPGRLAHFVVGSNVDAERNLHAVIPLLGEFGDVRAISTVYESPAVGVGDQPPYLNVAVLVETHATPDQLFDELIPFVEHQIGERPRAARTGESAPRRIDVDLVLYEDQTGRFGDHVLPADHDLRRPYAIVPLAEISGDCLHPNTNASLAEMAEAVDSTTLVARPDVRLDAVLPALATAADDSTR